MSINSLKYKVNKAVDIADYAMSKYNHEINRDGKSKCINPKHKDNNPSMSHYSDSNRFYCHTCGQSWTPVKMVELVENISEKQAVKIVSKDNGVYLSKESMLKEMYYDFLVYYRNIAHDLLVNSDSEDVKEARLYLYYRGFTDDLIKEKMIGYVNDTLDNLLTEYLADKVELYSLLEQNKIFKREEYMSLIYNDDIYSQKLKYRIIFSICDLEGKVTTLQGRWINEEARIVSYVSRSGEEVNYEHAKYYTCKNIDDIYIYNAEIINDSKELIIVEGVPDALTLILKGYPNTVAVLGLNNMEKNQAVVDALRNVNKVYVLLDNDDAGNSKIEEYAELLGRNTHICKLDYSHGLIINDSYSENSVDSKYIDDNITDVNGIFDIMLTEQEQGVIEDADSTFKEFIKSVLDNADGYMMTLFDDYIDHMQSDNDEDDRRFNKVASFLMKHYIDLSNNSSNLTFTMLMQELGEAYLSNFPDFDVTGKLKVVSNKLCDIAELVYEDEFELVKYQVNESDLAEKYYCKFAKDAFYESRSKRWYAWNGQIYDGDGGEGIILSNLNKFLDEIVYASSRISKLYKVFDSFYVETDKRYVHGYKDELSIVKSARACAVRIKQGRALATLKLMSKKINLIIPYEKLNRYGQRDVLVFQNGYLDLDTFELIPFNDLTQTEKDLYITQQLEFDYDESVEAPSFMKMCQEIMVNEDGETDEELLNYLLKVLSSAVSVTRPRAWIYLVASGRNGKSTLTTVVDKSLGTFAVKGNSQLIVKNSRMSASNEESSKAKMENKRFVFFDELEDGDVLNEKRMKEWVSADTIEVTAKYENSKDISGVQTFFVCTNEMAYIKATSRAVWDRMVIIPFHARFADETEYKTLSDDEKKYTKRADSTLVAKLEGEKQGVVMTLLKHFKELKSLGGYDKLIKPKVVTDLVEEYRSGFDNRSHFIEEHCELAKDEAYNTSGLFKAFSSFMTEDQGYKSVGMKDKQFKKEMESDGFKVFKSGTNYYRGIKISEESRFYNPSYDLKKKKSSALNKSKTRRAKLSAV